MKHLFLHCRQAAMVLLAVCMLWGCDLKAKPIDIGPPAPRPHMGLKLKVVEGAKYMDESFWDEHARALLIMKVKPGSAAADAGVLEGDLLLKIDGRPVYGMRDSVSIMSQKRPGENVMLGIYRGGEERQFGVELDPRPAAE